MKHKVRVVLKKATNSLRLLANYSAERKTKKKNGTKKVRGRSKDKYHHTHSHTKALLIPCIWRTNKRLAW
jgi:hypothetical protein